MKIRELQVKADQEQICRTCPHQFDRFWQTSARQVLRHEREGGDANDLRCDPVKPDRLMRITPDGVRPVAESKGALLETCGQEILPKCLGCSRFRPETASVPGGVNTNGRTWFRQVVIGGHCSIPVDGIVKDGQVVFCDRIHKTPYTPDHNCYTCGNLAWTTDEQQYNHVTPVTVDLSPIQMHKIQKAFPDDPRLEIWKARQILGNVRAPKGPGTTETSWCAPGIRHFYAADVIEITSTPNEWVEREAEYEIVPETIQVEDYGSEAWRVWGQYVYKTRDEFDAHWRPTPRTKEIGKVKRLKVLPVFASSGTKPVSYKVRFRGAGTVAEISTASADDTTGILYLTKNPDRVVVEFMSPHHRRYGLNDHDMVYPRKFGHVECPQCHGDVLRPGTIWNKTGCGHCGTSGTDRFGNVGKVPDMPKKVIEKPRISHLAEESCPRCEPGKPCYWHAKAPVVLEIDGQYATSVKYYRPQGNALTVLSEPKLIVNDDGIVTDIEGGEPNPQMFRVWLRSLCEFHPTHARKIRRQFANMKHSLPTARSRQVNLAFGAFSSVEPGKPYCSLFALDPRKGLDLREVLGDRFGDPRSVMGTNPAYDRRRPERASDSYFSWTKHTELTDWQEVTDLGTRVAEEQSASEAHLAAKREDQEIAPFVMPDEPTVMQLPMLVDETNENKEIWSPREYQDWLDEEVEEPIDDEGNVRIVSRRWQHYSYELRRKVTLKAARDMPETVAFKNIPDPSDRLDEPPRVGFWCTRPSCGEFYAVDEVEAGDPRCQHELDDGRTCNAPLTFFEKDAEDRQGHMQTPYVRTGGPKLAGSINSPRWNQQGMLLRTGCDDWRPKPWARTRSGALPTPPAPPKPRPDYSGLKDRLLTVEIEGEKLRLLIGTDTSIDSPLIRAFTQWTGQSREFTYYGGTGRLITARVLGLE